MVIKYFLNVRDCTFRLSDIEDIPAPMIIREYAINRQNHLAADLVSHIGLPAIVIVNILLHLRIPGVLFGHLVEQGDGGVLYTLAHLGSSSDIAYGKSAATFWMLNRVKSYFTISPTMLWYFSRILEVSLPTNSLLLNSADQYFHRTSFKYLLTLGMLP